MIGNAWWTSASHSGNPLGQGQVNYNYRIGKYDVTLTQYAAFLNSVAASDPYSLYNPNLATDMTVAGISRSGSSGSYTYAVIGSGRWPGGRCELVRRHTLCKLAQQRPGGFGFHRSWHLHHHGWRPLTRGRSRSPTAVLNVPLVH